MKNYRIIAFVAMILAFGVLSLGAYTRLTDAGLGCPDWPGCYGHMVLPSESSGLESAQSHYPEVPIEARKAWTEMAHRYAAGTLVLLVVVMTLAYRKQDRLPKLPLFMLALIGCQAALGMWTVTLKLLPVVVMGHLLGGLFIFGSLVYWNCLLSGKAGVGARGFRPWIDLALILVVCQIALGGWVSSNYAGLACIGFPSCNGQWLPAVSWYKSFHLWSSFGANHQGGLLDMDSRATIQMVHRLGAAVVVMYLTGLSFILFKKVPEVGARMVAMMILFCLLLQCVLGVVNVMYLLPLWAAVAHHACADLIFALLLVLRYRLLTGTSYVCRT